MRVGSKLRGLGSGHGRVLGALAAAVTLCAPVGGLAETVKTPAAAGIASAPAMKGVSNKSAGGSAATSAVIPAATSAATGGAAITTQKPAAAGVSPSPSSPPVQFVAAAFSDLTGWAEDDHLAALRAFQKSCAAIVRAAAAGKQGLSADIVQICPLAHGVKASKAAARAFFERHFVPHRVVHAGVEGLLTGYYEPLVAGSRVETEKYKTPIYRRPADLVNLVEESQRGAKADQPTHARQGAKGLEPYPTRAEIEAGALADKSLELLYFEDPIDVFFMQVQGSARIELPGGDKVRITYDGKNGHAYTSLGRKLIEAGIMREDEMSLAALWRWLKADPERARKLMHENKSYVFFRELAGGEGEAAMGVMHIPLTPLRSLAVDAGHHAIGTPIWVSSPQLKHAGGGKDAAGFARLMIAQDVGSAIRGPERGDIFFGSGQRAGRAAGVTKHAGNFFVLLPVSAGQTAGAGSGKDAAPPVPARSARQ